MNKKIDNYLKTLNSIPEKKLNQEYIYKEIICHDNKQTNNNIKNIEEIYQELKKIKLNNINLTDNSIQISNTILLDNEYKKIEISIFIKIDNTFDTIEKIVSYCNKKKIKIEGKINICNNIVYLTIAMTDPDESLKLIDYINSKLNENIYSSNPLCFSIGNVMISINLTYSYLEILSMYLYEFITKMKNLNIVIDYNNFKEFMIDNYFKIDNQIDMYKYLEYNKKEIKISEYFINLDILTQLIMYLFNQNDYEEFKIYLKKLNRKKSKELSKFNNYDNLDNCQKLFEELVKKTYLYYDEEQTKNSIINYMKTGQLEYITRKENLRKKITSSKEFMIYLRKIDIDKEINIILDELILEKKVKILEKICKEIYVTYLDNDNKNLGKIQIARALIRMQYEDYSTITRNNDARNMAKENIDPEEVLKIIKKTLCINETKKETDLYILYAEYIENLFNS